MIRFWPIILVLFGLGYFATGIYQVRPGEQAVVRRFGKVLEEPRGPGLNIGLPWGMDRVDRVAVDEQRQITVGYMETDQPPIDAAPGGQVLTGDNHLVDVRATVYYRVDRDRPGAVADYVLNAGRLQGILERATEVALASVLAGQRVDQVLLGQARNLEPLLQEHLTRALFPYRLGVAIESVNLTLVQPPAELVEVFREVNRARTQKEIAEREALSARQTEVSLARNEALKVRAETQAAAHNKLTRARAEAENFLALWRKYRDYADASSNALLDLYLKEMQAILARFQVRTISDPHVNQTIVMPLPEK
jgi:membrane protease subunit HflK